MKHCPQCDTGYPDSHTTCPTHGLLLNEIRDLKPGMVIHQSYRIIRKLGQGGMGAVYLAQHTLMDEPRALKFLSPELSRDQAFTGRFLREVRVLRQIRNHNVVDCGDLEAAEDGSLFFSMEFVDGPDLRGFLQSCHPERTLSAAKGESNDLHLPFGALPVPLALSIARGIAEGLGAAHSKGMVHRDIKPENILMARDAAAWLPKIADFGIVATKESSTAYTRTGGTLLTMAYAAPEQWRGTPAASLDGRTDLYALGCLLYEMLTGQTPFQAENYESWARQHQTTPPQPPSILRPDLANWQGLDALVLRLLAKDREDRPNNVAELLGLLDLVIYLPPQPVRVPTVHDSTPRKAPPAATLPMSAPIAQQPVAKPAPPRRRGKVWPIIMVVLLVALCITGLITFVAAKNSSKSAHRAHIQAVVPRALFGSTASVETVAFSPDGRTLASGDAEAAELWNLDSGKWTHTLTGHSAWVLSVAFSPDGRTLATGSVDNTIKLWDVASGRLLRTLEGHSDAVQCVTFSPNGSTLASASSDRSIKLWDAATGQLIRTLLGHSDYVVSVAFSPDGGTLVSGSTDHLVMIWDSITGQLLHTLQGHKDIVLSVKFSPDGRTIASGSWDHTAKLWEAASGQLLATLEGHSSAVRSVAFSPDDRTLATAGDDGTIRLWDTATRKDLATFDSQYIGKDLSHQGIRSIVFSPDGRTLASGLGNYTIELWDLSALNQ
jgi:WD40 repeat protein/tRNA A-37 threonylcarbamoyl transferase component Bud32